MKIELGTRSLYESFMDLETFLIPLLLKKYRHLRQFELVLAIKRSSCSLELRERLECRLTILTF